MKVKELVELLKGEDQEMEVDVGSYEVYPGPFHIHKYIVNKGFDGEGTTRLSISPEALSTGYKK